MYMHRVRSVAVGEIVGDKVGQHKITDRSGEILLETVHMRSYPSHRFNVAQYIF